ncbi:MAG: hypothetical protein WAM96_16825 [Candidatus Acidiferrales bacterium]
MATAAETPNFIVFLIITARVLIIPRAPGGLRVRVQLLTPLDLRLPCDR